MPLYGAGTVQLAVPSASHPRPALPRTLFLPALSQSNQPSVCFIQFLSSRSEKSSRAWAPRDSLQKWASIVGGWVDGWLGWSGRAGTKSTLRPPSAAIATAEDLRQR